jgi:hypothetical protein
VVLVPHVLVEQVDAARGEGGMSEGVRTDGAERTSEPPQLASLCAREAPARTAATSSFERAPPACKFMRLGGPRKSRPYLLPLSEPARQPARPLRSDRPRRSAPLVRFTPSPRFTPLHSPAPLRFASLARSARPLRLPAPLARSARPLRSLAPLARPLARSLARSLATPHRSWRFWGRWSASMDS